MIVARLSEASKKYLMSNKPLLINVTQEARINKLHCWIHNDEEAIKYKKHFLKYLIKSGTPRILWKNTDGLNEFGDKP